MAKWLTRSVAARIFVGSNPTLCFKLLKMKTAIIVHGWEGSPQEPIHLWIKSKLEEREYRVFVPEMPNPEEPEINSWVEEINEFSKDLTEESVLIGHSVGCQTILRFLEKCGENVKVKKCILIAPWMNLNKEAILEEGEEAMEIARPWLETPLDFDKVKSHCESFVCMFSDNDPYVPLSDKEIFKNKLNAKILVLEKRAHFNPDGGVKDIPEILNFI